MATRAQSPPKPDIQAHQEASLLTFAEIVSRLSEIVGKKLIAYVAGVKDVRTVEGWINGAGPQKEADPRLRLMFQVVRMLTLAETKPIIQAWLMGVNPILGDRVPIRVLREGDLAEVGPEIMGAARAFLAGG